MRIHIVQKGDTLWKLAQKYGVNFEELKAANNHLSNPDLIMPGMKIKIPSGSVQGKKEAILPTPKESKKEAPVKEKTPPPSLKEEKETPIKMPAPPKVQPHMYQLQSNMNVNIYKEKTKQPKMPAPPKMPKPKEVPVVEKPIEKKPVEKKPVTPKMPMEKAPMVKPVPTAVKPLPADCHPVTPVYQQPGYCPPYPSYPYPYGCGYPMQGHTPAPMAQPSQYGAQPHYGMPYHQGEHGHQSHVPNAAHFGDVTAYQVQTQPMPHYSGTHPAYGYNPYVQHGFAPGYYPQQGIWREETEDDGEENNS